MSGEWFRPFGLTVVTSVLVSLFISFTLDPMLSAYWGDPPGHHLQPRKGLGISLLVQRFNHLVRSPGRIVMAGSLRGRCITESGCSCSPVCQLCRWQSVLAG